MTSVTIRPLHDDDLPAMLAIYNDAIIHTTATWVSEPTTLDERRTWWQGRVDDGFPVLAAIKDSVCVGFASYGLFRAGPGYRFTRELSVYVEGAHRKQGIADKLLAALEDHAREAGVHVLVGGLEADNAPSLALHLKRGYAEVARMPQVGFKFDRWLDLVMLQKVL